MTTKQTMGKQSEISGSATEAVDDPVRIEHRGALAVITLNRPRALNALNDEMRASIAEVLPGYIRNPNVYAVAIQSSSERAFCAGGDVRELSRLAQSDLALGRKSLADEYSLNWQLDCFNKPTVSLINGMCVGSGVGLTLYNTHRVAGENYSFCMPETGIGLFPDLGVCNTLAQLPDQLGIYLGLTGRAIDRADAHMLGLVTHCIPAQRFPEIISALEDAEPVDPILDDRDTDPGAPSLDAYRGIINRAFSGDSVEAIIATLTEQANSTGQTGAFCRGVLDDLARRSPTSLKITLRHLRKSRAWDLRETLEWDHCLAGHCLAAGDFHEGVRAILIDKDQNPQWNPTRLTEVSDSVIDGYFEKREDDALELQSREEMQ